MHNNVENVFLVDYAQWLAAKQTTTVNLKEIYFFQ